MESRLKQIRKALKVTQEELGLTFGITKSALSMIETGRQALSERNKNILVQVLNVNPEWLESGRGEMFNSPPEYRPHLRGEGDAVPFIRVPLYKMDANVGLVSLLDDSAAQKPVDYIHIPNLPRCDGAVYIAGDGMFPLLKGGDIALYKKLRDLNDIFWGDMYLLSIDMDGEEYITVKYVQKSDKEGYVKLTSQNPHHADKEVEMTKIRAIALVKASIRMNSMQ